MCKHYMHTCHIQMQNSPPYTQETVLILPPNNTNAAKSKPSAPLESHPAPNTSIHHEERRQKQKEARIHSNDRL